ncbi:MAG TPA: DUF2173 family protein [Candidatus Acidoferrum sp.]|nr:DUF2173 family protein [Candidatus Acidoferrum sp.]
MAMIRAEATRTKRRFIRRPTTWPGQSCCPTRCAYAGTRLSSSGSWPGSYEGLGRVRGVAAGEFAPDGRLVDYKAKMNMSPEMAAMTAQFCATVTMDINKLYSALVGQPAAAIR